MDARRRLNTAARAKRLPVSQVRLRKGTVVPVCLGRHERHWPGAGGGPNLRILQTYVMWERMVRLKLRPIYPKHIHRYPLNRSASGPLRRSGYLEKREVCWSCQEYV